MTDIGNDAFQGCERFSSICIPNSVTKVGSYAFRACYNVASIVVPNSMEFVGEFAFGCCGTLLSISLPTSTQFDGDPFGENFDVLDNILLLENSDDTYLENVIPGRFANLPMHEACYHDQVDMILERFIQLLKDHESKATQMELE